METMFDFFFLAGATFMLSIALVNSIYGEESQQRHGCGTKPRVYKRWKDRK